MSKAIVIVVENFPHREHGENCDHYPTRDEVKKTLAEAVRKAVSKPIEGQQSAWPGGVSVVTEVADADKLRIFARIV